MPRRINRFHQDPPPKPKPEPANHPVKSRIEILGLPRQAGKSMANYMVMPPEVTR